MGFGGVSHIELFDQFSSVDIGGRLPDVIGVRVVLPLDQIVDGVSHLL